MRWVKKSCKRSYSDRMEIKMRKMVVMAVAGFLWRKLRSRLWARSHPGQAAKRMRR